MLQKLFDRVQPRRPAGIGLASSRFSDFSREKYEHEREKMLRNTVARFTRGNVSVQQGRYVTSSDLEELRDALALRAQSVRENTD